MSQLTSPCPQCGGTGDNGACGWCGGQQTVYDLNTGTSIPCPRCKGTGVEPGDCVWCGGTGEVEDVEDDDGE